MKKIKIYRVMVKLSFIIFVLIGFSCSTRVSGQNVAKGKRYTYSPVANYSGTKGNDDKDLTDGVKKTGGRFWQDISTVGWGYQKDIQINIDLAESYSISGFLINSARGTAAEVEFPLNCFVFTSSDNENFYYQGDLMTTADSGSGAYKVQSFALKKASAGRFVKFIIRTKSKFVFVDEIEVYGKRMGVSTNSNNSGKVIKKAQLSSYADQLSRTSVSKAEALVANNTISSSTTNMKGLPREVILTPISGIQELNNFDFNSITSLQKSGSLNRSIASSPYGLNYFSLVNNSSKVERVKLNIANSGNNKVYEVLRVASLGRQNLWDALKLIKGDEILLQKGESKIIVVIVEGGMSGKVECTFSTSGNKIKRLPLMNNQASAIGNGGGGLNVNVWAYLDKPVLKENKAFVVDDLEKAHVNTIVVHSAFIDPVGTTDFNRLKSYLVNFKNLGDKKVLLFYNFQNNAASKFRGDKFLDAKWQTNFASWYSLMLRELSKIGVSSRNVYFYPFDEIKANEIADFIALNKWAKKTIPNFKSFVTIIDEKSYEAGNFADIVQASMFKIKTLKEIKAPNIWVYDVLDNARNRNPYSDYRLMAWKAYYYGISGIGFWNYSALPSINDASYKRTINGNQDYSVLYLGDNNEMLYSLRWIYFQMGVKDYKILKQAELKMGKSHVLNLVKRVIGNTKNENLADQVIGQIIGK